MGEQPIEGAVQARRWVLFTARRICEQGVVTHSRRRGLRVCEKGVFVDEKVLEEIGFHQEVIGRDSNSPLHLIREKEMEISGRVLTAKNEAERIVAEARRKAGEILRGAEAEAGQLVKSAETSAAAEAQAEAEQLRAGIGSEMRDLESRINERMEPAVAEIIRIVTTV